jgi:hypothetical protein
MVAILPAITEKFHYNLGPVKPWVNNAAYILGPRHNIKVIGGWRATDPFPDHPSGHALDFMIPNLAVGQSLANDAVANASALNIKYIIFNHRVWNPKQGWHPYTSTNNPHTDHVHITFNDSPGTANAGPAVNGGTATSATAVADTSQPVANCAWSFQLPTSPISQHQICLLTNTQARSIFAVFIGVGGVVISGVGLILLVKYGLRG